MKRTITLIVAMAVLLPGLADADDVRQEALRALRALHSATEVGLTYREYGTRLIDTKIIVDRDHHNDAADVLIRTAMDYYVRANAAWELRNCCWDGTLFDEMVDVLQKDRCPALQGLRRKAWGAAQADVPGGAAAVEAETTKLITPGTIRGDIPALIALPGAVRARLAINVVPALWSCAADSLSRAEVARR